MGSVWLNNTSIYAYKQFRLLLLLTYRVREYSIVKCVNLSPDSAKKKKIDMLIMQVFVCVCVFCSEYSSKRNIISLKFCFFLCVYVYNVLINFFLRHAVTVVNWNVVYLLLDLWECIERFLIKKIYINRICNTKSYVTDSYNIHRNWDCQNRHYTINILLKHKFHYVYF